MKHLDLNKVSSPVLFPAPPRGPVELASFQSADGKETLVCTANITPYSPTTGEPMQAKSSKKAAIPAEKLKNFVSVGTCNSCGSNLRAAASLADEIEIAHSHGEHVHCPMCSASFTPTIDIGELTKCLAAEFEDENDLGEDETFDLDDADDSEDIAEDDGEPVEDVESEDYSDELPDGGDDDDMLDEDMDMSDDDEIEAAAKEVSKMLVKRRKTTASEDEDGEFIDDVEDSNADDIEDDSDDVDDSDDTFSADDTDDMEDDAEDVDDLDDDSDADDIEDDSDDMEDDEMLAAVASLKRFRRKLVAADDSLDDAAETHDEPDGDEVFEEDQVVAALRETSRRATAGKPAPNAKAEAVVSSARANLKKSGRYTQGNKKILSKAGMDDLQGLDAVDEVNDPNIDRLDNQTPGTDKMNGDDMVDWTVANVEVLNVPNALDRIVTVNGNPVAKLVKAKASENIVAHWDSELLASTFKAVAARGLMKEESAEFGFSPLTFKVQASDVLRETVRRAVKVAAENANVKITESTSRFDQSVKTALLAATKGIYPTVKNPIRDKLVLELSRLGVEDAKAIVDGVFESASDDFAKSVLDFAGELTRKSDDARNEIATVVATANYQSRDVDPGSALTERLARGNDTATLAGLVSARGPNVVADTAADTTDSKSVDQLVRRMLSK